MPIRTSVKYVVVLWAAAIAGATALFHAAAPQRSGEGLEAFEEPVYSGHGGAD